MSKNKSILAKILSVVLVIVISGGSTYLLLSSSNTLNKTYKSERRDFSSKSKENFSNDVSEKERSNAEKYSSTKSSKSQETGTKKNVKKTSNNIFTLKNIEIIIPEQDMKYLIVKQEEDCIVFYSKTNVLDGSYSYPIAHLQINDNLDNVGSPGVFCFGIISNGNTTKYLTAQCVTDSATESVDEYLKAHDIVHNIYKYTHGLNGYTFTPQKIILK